MKRLSFQDIISDVISDICNPFQAYYQDLVVLYAEGIIFQ